MILAVAIAVIAGVVIGYAVARRRSPADEVGAPAPESQVIEQRDDDRSAVVDVLREAVDHLELGVVVSDRRGTVVYRNESASALRGTHVGVIVDGHLDTIIGRARSGVRSHEVVELHGPPKLALSLVAEPMPGGAAVATIEDVSERVRHDAVRTDFVANISHELKTPVGAIAVLAEALIDESDPVVVERVANRMVDEAHRAVRTIDDLLELSRIESARRDDEVISVNSVVQAAIARGRVADHGRGIRVDAFETPGSLRLRADGRQLVSALGNLVENAVKYSHDGGAVQVRVRADDRFVEVMVADHGVGIPERDLDRVFERFYRVDKARSRETGGTGLGLAIVRHVATNHGGEVVVSSQEGEGSTFAFRLPASLITEAAETPHGGTVAPLAAEAAATRPPIETETSP